MLTGDDGCIVCTEYFSARDSILCRARYMLSPVRLFVTRVDQSKTVEVIVRGLRGVLCAIRCPLILTLDPGSAPLGK